MSKENKTTLDKLIKIINKDKVSTNEIVSLLANLIFSVGSSLENEPDVKNSKDILINYGKSNTLGWALMAQAKLMQEAWVNTQLAKGKKE